jgi:hypothetical protein
VPDKSKREIAKIKDSILTAADSSMHSIGFGQYLKRLVMKDRFLRQALNTLFSAILLLLCTAVFAQENVDPYDDDSQYAWGENVGWLNLEPGGDGGPGVEVGEFELTGYIWAENIGWISLSCVNTYDCLTIDYGVANDGTGQLSGYAWGENVGWINFAPTGGGVYIDACGDFNGMAWGENIGWISFDSDGEHAFKVTTSWISPIDNIAPVTEPAAPIEPWYTGDVNLTLSATDCGSGVNEVHYVLDGGGEAITPGTSVTIDITTDGVHTLSYWSVDQDGNIELANEVTIHIDRTPPDISITSPGDGATYFLGEVVLADYAVADVTSGVATVTATVDDGNPIDTSAVGSYTFTVSATDTAGNSHSVTRTYAVATGGNIDPDNNGSQYAWGENIGWINFQPSFGPELESHWGRGGKRRHGAAVRLCLGRKRGLDQLCAHGRRGHYRSSHG